MNGIARRQTILTYIKQYQGQTGYSPTINEIANVVGLKPGSVHYHLVWLEIEGRIERQFNSPRAIKVL